MVSTEELVDRLRCPRLHVVVVVAHAPPTSHLAATGTHAWCRLSNWPGQLCPARPFRSTNMSKWSACYEGANNIHHINLGIQSINHVREPLSIIHPVFHYHELLCYAYMLGLQLYVKQNARQASCRRIYKPLAMETSHSLTISAAQTPLSVL